MHSVSSVSWQRSSNNEPKEGNEGGIRDLGLARNPWLRIALFTWGITRDLKSTVEDSANLEHYEHLHIPGAVRFAIELPQWCHCSCSRPFWRFRPLHKVRPVSGTFPHLGRGNASFEGYSSGLGNQPAPKQLIEPTKNIKLKDRLLSWICWESEGKGTFCCTGSGICGIGHRGPATGLFYDSFCEFQFTIN